MSNKIKSKKNLRIAHIHVWDKNNKGDHAIVLAVQELLKDRFKGCRIIDFSVTILRDGRASDIKKLNAADLIIIGGGGIFYSYFLPYNLQIISALTKPIVIFGAGYIREVGAPELKKDFALSVAALAKKAILVGVRDYNTKRFLNNNGVTLSKIKVIGDPAVLLREVKPAKFNIAPPYKKSDRPRSYRAAKISVPPIRVGFNLNYSGWLGFGQWRDDILTAYQSVAAYFIKKYGSQAGPGAEIYYLKHHPGEANIYPALGIKDLRVVDLKPAEQKYVYGQLDLVVGMMLHSGVLAFGAGTPEISVAYDLRNYSFAEFIKRPELVISLDKLKNGELLKRVKQVMAKKDYYHKLFLSKKAQINKSQIEFLDKIKKYDSF